MPSKPGHASILIGLTVVGTVCALAVPAQAQVVFPGQAMTDGPTSTWRAPPPSRSFSQQGGYVAGSIAGGIAGQAPFPVQDPWARPQAPQAPQPLTSIPLTGFVPAGPRPADIAQPSVLQQRPQEQQPRQDAVPERGQLRTEAPVPAMSSTAFLPGEVIRGGARAVDGGTFSLRGSLWRLAGITAPALGEACPSGPTSWRCGLVARDTLDRLLSRGPVSCTAIAQDGAATLAACRVGRDDIASSMVDAGLASAQDAALRGRERDAQADRRGIWSDRRR